MAGYRIPGPLCYKQGEDIDDGTMCRSRSPQPGSFGMPMRNDYQVLTSTPDWLGCYWPAFLFSNGSKNATEFSLGEKALSLLKSVEELHLKPYDDQTGKEITTWTQGATIGYGHLIKKTEWTTYKDGFSEADANTLFEQDLSPFVAAVCANINIKLKQNEFDALVILSFNNRGDWFRRVVGCETDQRSEGDYQLQGFQRGLDGVEQVSRQSYERS